MKSKEMTNKVYENDRGEILLIAYRIDYDSPGLSIRLEIVSNCVNCSN